MVRFECTRCGACCRRAGLVSISERELGLLARHLRLTPSTLRRRYGIDREDDGSYALEVEEGGACPFLANDMCSVDPVKPEQCRTFPFWPELIEDPAEMRRACEGVGRGDEVDPVRIGALSRGRGRI